MRVGTANIVIDRPALEVWSAIADITRMGEWSPECTGARWVGGATGPAVGAKFEGDNAVKVAGRTLKSWTTTSEVTASEPGTVFEFISADTTTWRYELLPSGAGTRVTETFSYSPGRFQRIWYETILRRTAGMTKGMATTLGRLQHGLEAGAAAPR